MNDLQGIIAQWTQEGGSSGTARGGGDSNPSGGMGDNQAPKYTNNGMPIAPQGIDGRNQWISDYTSWLSSPAAAANPEYSSMNRG